MRGIKDRFLLSARQCQSTECSTGSSSACEFSSSIGSKPASGFRRLASCGQERLHHVTSFNLSLIRHLPSEKRKVAGKANDRDPHCLFRGWIEAQQEIGIQLNRLGLPRTIKETGLTLEGKK